MINVIHIYWFFDQLTVWNMALVLMSTVPVEFLKLNREVVLASSSDGQCCWVPPTCLVQNFAPSWNTFLENIMGTLII